MTPLIKACEAGLGDIAALLLTYGAGMHSCQLRMIFVAVLWTVFC